MAERSCLSAALAEALALRQFLGAADIQQKLSAVDEAMALQLVAPTRNLASAGDLGKSQHPSLGDRTRFAAVASGKEATHSFERLMRVRVIFKRKSVTFVFLLQQHGLKMLFRFKLFHVRRDVLPGLNVGRTVLLWALT